MLKKKNIKKWLERKTMNSIKNLKIKKLDALLLQNSNSLLSKNGNEIYKSLKDMKIKGLTRKIGISIYNFNTLKEIIKKFKLDLIQAPFNVLDRRLVNKGWLRKLKKNKIWFCSYQNTRKHKKSKKRRLRRLSKVRKGQKRMLRRGKWLPSWRKNAS